METALPNTSRAPGLRVDDTHPDATILQAFERVRDHRAWAYNHLASTTPETHDKACADIEVKDVEAEKTERLILDSWATTPSGVAAQLAMSVAAWDCELWVDRGLMEQGLHALYEQRGRLDGRDAVLVIAAYELIHMEWEQALAAYEQAEADFNEVLVLKDVIDTEYFRTSRGDELEGDGLKCIFDQAALLEKRFCRGRPIGRLMSTLAPDRTAYQRKAQIAIDEHYTEEAALWLLRDVNFLMGRIDAESQPMEKAA